MKWRQLIKEKLGMEIKFPIIADDMGKVVTKVDMMHPGKGTNALLSVVLINPNGVVRIIFFYPKR